MMDHPAVDNPMDPVENKHDFFARKMICKWFVLHGLVGFMEGDSPFCDPQINKCGGGGAQKKHNVNSKAPREHQGESSLERLEKHLAGSRQPLSTNQPCVDEVTRTKGCPWPIIQHPLVASRQSPIKFSILLFQSSWTEKSSQLLIQPLFFLIFMVKSYCLLTKKPEI